MLTVEELEQSQLYRDASAPAHQAAMKEAGIERYQTVRRIIDAMATDLVTNLDAEIQRAHIDTVEAVRRTGRALALFSPAMAAQVDELKEIMRERLYRHYRVIRMTEKAGRVLEQLFNAYMSEPRQMPSHVLMLHEQDGEPIAARGGGLYRRA